MTVEEEQRENRSRSPHAYVDWPRNRETNPGSGPPVGHELRLARDGPVVIHHQEFLKIMWHRISFHAAKGSQQKLALSRLL